MHLPYRRILIHNAGKQIDAIHVPCRNCVWPESFNYWANEQFSSNNSIDSWHAHKHIRFQSKMMKPYLSPIKRCVYICANAKEVVPKVNIPHEYTYKRIASGCYPEPKCCFSMTRLFSLEFATFPIYSARSNIFIFRKSSTRLKFFENILNSQKGFFSKILVLFFSSI